MACAFHWVLLAGYDPVNPTRVKSALSEMFRAPPPPITMPEGQVMSTTFDTPAAPVVTGPDVKTCVTDVAPAAPVAPCGPCDPAAPGAPSWPLAPVGPMGPMGPCGPWGPTSP